MLAPCPLQAKNGGRFLRATQRKSLTSRKRRHVTWVVDDDTMMPLVSLYVDVTAPDPRNITGQNLVRVHLATEETQEAAFLGWRSLRFHGCLVRSRLRELLLQFFDLLLDTTLVVLVHCLYSQLHVVSNVSLQELCRLWFHPGVNDVLELTVCQLRKGMLDQDLEQVKKVSWHGTFDLYLQKIEQIFQPRNSQPPKRLKGITNEAKHQQPNTNKTASQPIVI